MTAAEIADALVAKIDAQMRDRINDNFRPHFPTDDEWARIYERHAAEFKEWQQAQLPSLISWIERRGATLQ